MVKITVVGTLDIIFHQCVLYSVAMKFLVQKHMFFDDPIDEVSDGNGDLISTRPIFDLLKVM